MEWLQQDRISTALQYWDSIQSSEQFSEQSIWYLSGGVKNALFSNNQNTVSEAERMGDSLKSKNMNIVLDTSATNTAENFRNFFKYVSSLEDSYSNL